jgi:chromate reductase, NAD(P)H dehydrogenase (quinone)
MVKLLLTGFLFFTLLRIQQLMSKKKVLAICGSTRAQSVNLSIIQYVGKLLSGEVEFEIYNELSALPHFNPDLDKDRAPEIVEALREKIKNADGVLICTPEYVFSLPGALKNAIEWCVSTTIFSEKPVVLITASASGAKAHESLRLVMKTIYADIRDETTLLIQGAKGKVNNKGEITDALTAEQLNKLANDFATLLNGKIISRIVL